MIAAEVTSPPILEFDDVTVTASSHRFAPLRGVTLAIGPGQMVVVRVEAGRDELPLAAAAEGLIEPDGGIVRFVGEAWNDANPTYDARRRGQIGRVYEQWGWVSNLDVHENVTLALRHHTSRPTRELEAAADRLAVRFGLERVPRQRPSYVPAGDLRRAEWVRALLGEPQLLLLERPMRYAPATALDPLLEAVAEARERGAAALWTIGTDAVWRRVAPAATARYAVHDDKLERATE